MYLNPHDKGISQTLIRNGTREKQLKYILEEEVKNGDAVIDLGANIGYYSLMLWRLVGPSGKVYALEPSPENFTLLIKNVFLNKAQDIIETFQIAGAESVSEKRFFLAEHSNLNTFIPELCRCGMASKTITDKYIIVETTDMSTFISGKRNVSLIRMDIEGYEVEVLKGLRGVIENELFTGKILFECHFPKYDDKNHSMREQLQMLFKNGYYPKILTSNDERLTRFGDRAYKPQALIRTGVDRLQGIYRNVAMSDAEYFICDVGGVRDILLEKQI